MLLRNVEKGFARIDWAAWIDAWCVHPVSAHMPLVPTQCLGPCDAGNVVLLRCGGSAFWLGNVERKHMHALFSFARRVLDVGASAHPGGDIAALLFMPISIAQSSS